MVTVSSSLVEKSSPIVGLNCGYDHAPILVGDEAVNCPVCNTPHHRTCWSANQNHCTVLGCTGAGQPVSGTAPSPTPTPVPSPSNTWLKVLAAVAVLAIIGFFLIPRERPQPPPGPTVAIVAPTVPNGSDDEVDEPTVVVDTDSDNDDFANEEGQDLGTGPQNSDSDGDELDDDKEVDTYGTDPNDPDSDGDGIDDGEEVNTHGTDPTERDSDGDSLDDRAEIRTHETDPNDPDSDGDGLDDDEELQDFDTNPNDRDSDDDSLDDGEEILNYETNPRRADTDGDGMKDGAEVALGRNPRVDDAPPPQPPQPTTVDWYEFGSTVRGKPLEVVRFGDGPNAIMLVGGIHAGFAPASVAIAEGLIAYFEENPGEIPNSVSVYIIPSLNKDSRYDPGEWSGRINANSVDLNRNWDCDWKRDATWRNDVKRGSGGSEPFSEPETRALRDLLLQVDPKVVIFWGALIRDGLVAPGQCSRATATTELSYDVAEVFGRASGYSVNDYEVVANQVINGDAANWLDKVGIPSFYVVLEDYEATNWRGNLAGVLAVLRSYAD